jgi:hypothetical protein
VLQVSRVGSYSVVDECRCCFVADCGRGNSVVSDGGLVLVYVCGTVYIVMGGERLML